MCLVISSVKLWRSYSCLGNSFVKVGCHCPVPPQGGSFGYEPLMEDNRRRTRGPWEVIRSTQTSWKWHRIMRLTFIPEVKRGQRGICEILVATADMKH